MRIWPPEEHEPWPLVCSSAERLCDVWVYFELSFISEVEAEKFARYFRSRFTRSTATTRRATVWGRMRMGAVDAADAALQCVAGIKVVADLPLLTTPPVGGQFHDADVVGEVPADVMTRVRADREALLAYAAAHGLELSWIRRLAEMQDRALPAGA